MRNIYAFLILFSISLAFIKCEMSADNVMIAINCGGEAHKDSRGILYEQVIEYVIVRIIISQEARVRTSGPISKSNSQMTQMSTKQNDGEVRTFHMISL